jgi:hypothetical protein
MIRNHLNNAALKELNIPNRRTASNLRPPFLSFFLWGSKERTKRIFQDKKVTGFKGVALNLTTHIFGFKFDRLLLQHSQFTPIILINFLLLYERRSTRAELPGGGGLSVNYTNHPVTACAFATSSSSIWRIWR